eukprot:CAMPEP_0174346166 /NCGR_PEP_ID=MMETSP0811_2-20130205/1797_1 /TAXON_ID=73025 ORGANISM="Eutreptiella gymnastica-like, Strain CCMP1594" /NCGR_SAMPLE_ID=MMETSP0811_2 /ASSEMBLY_ACC=CAM_ASM_000667 /LENGTH=59 /DNA_ID=CAMNT_0015470483 /DNA_START=76 /DNA_END=252 /DNA_ORIENTATION=-
MAGEKLFPQILTQSSSDDSSSCSDSGEDSESQIVWAWGLGHVFEGKFYFTKDIVDDSFV